MSVEAGVEGQGTPEEPPVVQPEVTPPTPEVSTNPLYAEYLEKIPEGFRPIVEPVFKDWDAGVTRKFQEVHQQYDPWKPVIESGFDPNVAQQSLQLVQALEQQPESVLLALAQAYGVELAKPEVAPPVTPDPTGDEDELDPRLKQHEEMLQTMGQYLVQQQQQAQQAEEDRRLQETLSTLKTQHGDFNERYVLALMAQGASPEQAVQQFKADLQQFTADQKASAAPVVVGPGGGVPANTVDPSQLGDKDTKNLVVQLLAQANQQNRS